MVKRKSNQDSNSEASSLEECSLSSSSDSVSSDENIAISNSPSNLRASQKRKKDNNAAPKRRLRSSEPSNGFNVKARKPVGTEIKKKTKKEIKCPNCKGLFFSLSRHKSKCLKLAITDTEILRRPKLPNSKTATRERPKKTASDLKKPTKDKHMSLKNSNTNTEGKQEPLVAKKRGRPKKTEASRKLFPQNTSTTPTKGLPTKAEGVKSVNGGTSATEIFRCSLCGNVYRTMDSLTKHTLSCYSDDLSSDYESETDDIPQQKTEATHSQPHCSNARATPPNEMVLEQENSVQISPAPTQSSPDVFVQPLETPPQLEFTGPHTTPLMENLPAQELQTNNPLVEKFDYLKPIVAPPAMNTCYSQPQPQILGPMPLQLGIGFEHKRAPDLHATTYPSWSNNLNPVPSTHADSQRQIVFESPLQSHEQYQRNFNDIMACVGKDSPGFILNPAHHQHSMFQNPTSNITSHFSTPASSNNMILELKRLVMNPAAYANQNQLNPSCSHLRQPHQMMAGYRQTQQHNLRPDINHNENLYATTHNPSNSLNPNLNYSAIIASGSSPLIPQYPQQQTLIPDWGNNGIGYSNQNHRFGGGVYGITSGGYYPSSIPSLPNSNVGMQVVSMLDTANGQIVSFQVPCPYTPQPELQHAPIQPQHLYQQQMSAQNYHFLQQQQQLQLQIQQNEQQIAAVRLQEQQQQQQQSLQSGVSACFDPSIQRPNENPYTSEALVTEHGIGLGQIQQNITNANSDPVAVPSPTPVAAPNYIVEPPSSPPTCPQPSILTDLIKMVSPQVPSSSPKSKLTAVSDDSVSLPVSVGAETLNSVQNELDQPVQFQRCDSKQKEAEPCRIQDFAERRANKFIRPTPRLRKPKTGVVVKHATENAARKRLRDSIIKTIETVVANCLKSPEKGSQNVAVVRPSDHLVASNQLTQESSSPPSSSLIKVTLKRKEGADSYSIDNVINPGVPGTLGGAMRNLKIKAKITSGGSAGASSDIVVWPVIITNRIAGAGNLKLGTMTHQLVISYEVRSEDTVLFRSSDVHAVWNYIFETVQGATVNHSLSPLSFPAALIALPDENNEAQLKSVHLELAHRGVQFLLAQLPGPDSNKSTCARTDGFKGRKPFDMFAWLASKHRTPLFSVLKPDLSKMAKLPMAEMYRNLIRQGTKHLFVLWSKIHGRGLFSRVDIDEGDMVIEYAGEVIRTPVCERREKWYSQKGIDCFMFKMDDDYVVDASLKGNAARFINHSCEPNCKSKVLEIMGKKHILIFSIKRIPSGEELTYDYKFAFEDVKIPCHCGSSKCRKFLN